MRSTITKLLPVVNDNTFQRTCNLLNTNTSTYTILKCLPFTSPLLDDPGKVFGSGSSKRTARSVEFQQPIYSEKEKNIRRAALESVSYGNLCETLK